MRRYIALLIFVFMQGIAFAQIPLNGLVGYYPLNGNANDSSGNAFNGTVNGPTPDVGVCSPAYRFINNYIDCGDPVNNEFDLVGDASLCFWFKLKATPFGAGFTVLGKDVSGGSVEKWFVSIFSDSVSFHINGPSWGSGYWRYSNKKHFAIDTFYHVVITKQVNNYEFFINAAPWGMRTFPVNILDVPHSLHIGQNEAISTNTVIDEVLIYNRVLTQPEINAIYNACNTQPVSAGFNTGNTTVCAGTCIGFNNTSINAATYQWSFPGAAITASNDTTPMGICYPTPGQYDVQLIAFNGSLSDTLLLPKYITVNAVPVAGTVTTAADTICAGAQDSLTVSGSAGTIQWQSSANGTTFVDINGAVNGTYIISSLNQTTYYRVKALSTACGADSSAVIVITVLPASVAGVVSALKDTVCEGTPANLLVTGSTGTIQWQSSPASSFADINGANASTYNTPPLLQSTCYRITTGNAQCADTSNVHCIYVPPALTASFTFTRTGAYTLSFNSDSSKGDITLYSWDFGDSTTSNLKNPVHTYTGCCNFTICLTVYDGSNCSFTYCIDYEFEGVPTIPAGAGWIIYPNPASSELWIKPRLNNMLADEISLQDVLGRTVLSQAVNASQRLHKLDISTLADGIYILSIQSPSALYTEKIIVQKQH